MADNKQGASQALQMSELPRLRRLFDDRTHTLNDMNIIGRHADCELFIDDEKGVSRKHARITVEDGSVFIEDLGSLNGTLINGHESEGKQPLNNGDILIFDEQEYELFIPYATYDEFDSSMTVIANRSAIKKRVEKKRIKKKRAASEKAATDSPTTAPDDESTSPDLAPPRLQKESEHTQELDAFEADENGHSAFESTSDSFAAEQSADQPNSDQAFGSTPGFNERQPMLNPATLDADSIDRKAANHTIIEQPRRPATPAMRIVDDNFLKEVQDHPSETGSPENSQYQKKSATSAAREAFDVSDDEVEEILHEQGSDDIATSFASAEDSQLSSDAASVGTAPFLSARIDGDSPEAAAFTRDLSANLDESQSLVDHSIVHAHIVVLNGRSHQRLPLAGDRSSWNIGSDASADVIISADGVDTDHAIILREDTMWTLCDRGTRGGCAVNGHEVNVARIQTGDRLNIGSAECLFIVPDDEAELANPRPAVSAPEVRSPLIAEPVEAIDVAPKARVEIPMDDRIWDEHEQQLYRDTSRDQVLRNRTSSSRHDLEPGAAASAPMRPRPANRNNWEPEYESQGGLSRFLPSARTTMALVLGVVALAILGALGYLIL